VLGRLVAQFEERFDEIPQEEDIVAALEAALQGATTEDRTGSVTGAMLYHLRCTFSQLKEAFILLERHLPAEALEALPGKYTRMRLTELTPDCTHSARGDSVPGLECPQCCEFLRENPPYLNLLNRQTRLFQDGVRLAIDSHLASAEAALISREANLEESFSHWRQAIALARNVGMQVRTKQSVVRTVLGRASVLEDERGQQRGERLSQAIELVERSRRMLGGVDEDRLKEQQSVLLTARGVWFGYGCHDWETPDYEKAASDLREALNLRPTSITARDNLARALVYHATNLRLNGASGSAWRLAAEALQVVDKGLRQFPDHARLQKMLLQVLEEIEDLAGSESLEATLERLDKVITPRATTDNSRDRAQKLLVVARTRVAQRDISGAIIDLVEAARLIPEDRIRDELLGAVGLKLGSQAEKADAP
jgi:tetratricopeptide (TPR) repeat protein